MKEFTVKTTNHSEFVEISDRIQEIVRESGVEEGVCAVVISHTTAGITVNENADPDVAADMLYALEQVVPWQSGHYRHGEGNSAAHVKSSLVGHSVTLPIHGGLLQFGRWQGVFLCEFDGPRNRKVWVSVVG